MRPRFWSDIGTKSLVERAAAGSGFPLAGDWMPCLNPCPRRVRTCLTLLICLALLVLVLYLDIVAILFWDSFLMRHGQPTMVGGQSAVGEPAEGEADEQRQMSGQQKQQGQKMSKQRSNNNKTSVENRTTFEANADKIRKDFEMALSKMTKGIPLANEGQWCERMVQGKLNRSEEKQLKEWKFNETDFQIWLEPALTSPWDLPEGSCSAVRQRFAFPTEPLTEEERDFPIAYGMLVHKSTFQVFTLLGAIYQPQNAYCVAVDAQAEEQFKTDLERLADCFPNIFVIGVGKVKWCEHEVVRGVFACLRHLAALKHDWRYYQYLSGVDLPLKTNLEMVRIFKRLNGTVNVEVLPFEMARITGIQGYMRPQMTLWKSSLSALISRQAANAIVESEKVRQLLRYLAYGFCTDETIWATITGNPNEVFIPGGFDASTFYSLLFKETYLSEMKQLRRDYDLKLPQQSTTVVVQQQKIGASTNESASADDVGRGDLLAEPFPLSTYYISRFQVWRKTSLVSGSKVTQCSGKFVKDSCVFGIGDLPRLVRRPELVTHKLYLDTEPAAYFCLYKTVRERALDWRRQQSFQGELYAKLPLVRMARGDPPHELRFFFD